MQDLATLNRYYSRHNKLNFVNGAGGMPQVEINTVRATARIALYGGQLLSYKPTHTEHDLLYLSEQAIYQQGKAIRGGVPLCWPWFGDDPEQKGRQAHGFARNLLWEVFDVQIHDNVVSITLGIDATATSKQWWKQDFRLRKTIKIGDTLSISLATENRGKQSLSISEALHSYFLVGDVNKVQVKGLDKVSYLDKTLGFAQDNQQGPILFSQEFDRIYLQAPPSAVIEDNCLQRAIEIRHLGAENFVVWNPWDKAQALSDMADDDYQRFVCVETANALANSVMLASGETHTMTVDYSIRSLSA